MENAIREMQQSLVDDYYVAFIFKNDAPRFQLGKSDEFHLLNDEWIVIRKENGIIQVINLNFISEIRIRRKSYNEQASKTIPKRGTNESKSKNDLGK